MDSLSTSASPVGLGYVTLDVGAPKLAGESVQDCPGAGNVGGFE
jgi:hypothetical protein